MLPASTRTARTHNNGRLAHPARRLFLLLLFPTDRQIEVLKEVASIRFPPLVLQ